MKHYLANFLFAALAVVSLAMPAHAANVVLPGGYLDNSTYDLDIPLVLKHINRFECVLSDVSDNTRTTWDNSSWDEVNCGPAVSDKPLYDDLVALNTNAHKRINALGAERGAFAAHTELPTIKADLATAASNIATMSASMATMSSTMSSMAATVAGKQNAISAASNIADAATNAATDAATNAPTNLNVVTTLLGTLTGEVNATNAKQNALAAKYNDLAGKYNDLSTKTNLLFTHLEAQGLQTP